MRKFRKWILLLVIVACAVAAVYWRLGPVTVDVTTPVRGAAIEAIYATGSVEPTVMLPIASRVAGTLVELAADEGSRVHKGQVLARIEDRDLNSTVEELEARARFAREDFSRTQDLVQKGFVSPGELDSKRAEMEAAAASLRRASAQRDFTALKAPADGVIIRRDGEVGQYFPAGQALFTLACCAPLRVSVEVDEEDILKVHVGQKAVLRTDALAGQVLDGEVAQLTPKGDPVARSYRVRIRLADASPLRVGMTVDANLVVAEHANALLVPSAAVQAGTVWVVRDGHLHRQAVRAGVLGPERTEILEGLDEGAQIVLAPIDGLKEGRSARVRIGAAVAGGTTGAAAAAPAPPAKSP